MFDRTCQPETIAAGGSCEVLLPHRVEAALHDERRGVLELVAPLDHLHG